MFITGAMQEGIACLALFPPVNHKIIRWQMLLLLLLLWGSPCLSDSKDLCHWLKCFQLADLPASLGIPKCHQGEVVKHKAKSLAVKLYARFVTKVLGKS